MILEQALAAKQIAKLLDLGYGKTVCIRDAASLLVSQGFSKQHSEKIASEMFDLLA